MKPRVGDVVRIDLLDHAEDADGAIAITVFGRVAVQDDATITVDSWAYTDQKAERDHNMKAFTIIRSAIVEIRRLEPGPALDASPRRKGKRRA